MKTTIYIEAEGLARELAWFDARRRILTEAEEVQMSRLEKRLDLLWLEYFAEDEQKSFNTFCDSVWKDDVDR